MFAYVAYVSSVSLILASICIPGQIFNATRLAAEQYVVLYGTLLRVSLGSHLKT